LLIAPRCHCTRFASVIHSTDTDHWRSNAEITRFLISKVSNILAQPMGSERKGAEFNRRENNDIVKMASTQAQTSMNRTYRHGANERNLAGKKRRLAP